MRQTISTAAMTFLFGLVVICIGCNNKPGNNPGNGSVAQVKKLNVGGATFIAPMMDKWSFEYKKKGGTEINYNATGSGAGIKGLIDRTYDYACSDAPMNDKQLEEAKAANGDVVHIPQALGAVVAAYHLDGVNQDLTLSGEVLADIYLGKITKWNDPAIVALNNGVNLPDLPIAVCFRSDGSGTNYIFVDYLSKVSDQFKKDIGVGTSVKFPVGNGAEKNPGVANLVKSTNGAIGYLELIYALNEPTIKAAKIKNREGNVVAPSVESVTAAADGALTDIPEDLRFSLTNGPGKDAYPISGANYALVFAKQPAKKKQAIVDFLTYVTHDGQKLCPQLHYAPLPKGLVERIEKKLAMITAAGE
jgi:phosphate transport system substrate-binding protein